MIVNPFTGKSAKPYMLINVAKLVTVYYSIIISIVLVSAQSWGGDNAYNIKMNRVKLDFLACASDYDLSQLRDSIDEAFSIAENQNNKKSYNCEAKLDEYIIQDANGDYAIDEGLTSVISYMANDESSSKKIFAHKYARKLQKAKQRAMMKTTSPHEDKVSDKRKSDHE